jgi:hypothetical protein
MQVLNNAAVAFKILQVLMYLCNVIPHIYTNLYSRKQKKLLSVEYSLQPC